MFYDDSDYYDPYECYEDDREEFEQRMLWEDSLADAAWECGCADCAELDELDEEGGESDND